jgi:hypothetical protein
MLCRLLLITVFVLVSAGAANAQLPLLPPAVADSSLDGPNVLKLADIDRDGDLDMVVAAGTDATGGEVAWRAFDASTGSWGAKVVIDGSFAFALDVAVGDLDRDGDPDVVAVSKSGDEVAWWENVADGSTWTPHTVALGAALVDGPVAVEVADLDLDGDPDLAVALLDSDTLGWFENDGTPANGGWTPHPVSATPVGEPAGLTVADIDGDGDPDLAAAAEDGHRIAWWENDGTPADDSGGDGTSWTYHLVGDEFLGAADVLAADLDRDGDLDLAGVARTDDEIAWWENTNGDATAWAPHSIGALDGPETLSAHDLDHDGDVDLLAASVDDGRVLWWENTGTGWTNHEVTASFPGARTVAAGDIGGDGDLDLVVCSVSQDRIDWFENDPIHRTVSWVEVVVDPDGADAATTADLDQDGDIDVVGGGFLTWWERQPGGWVEHLVDSLPGVPAGSILSAAIGDIDRDGDPDIAATTFNRVYWWESDGTLGDGVGGGLGNSWTRHEVSIGHIRMTEIAIADIDRDGHPDLVAADLNGDEVRWWRNDGSPADGVGGDGNSWTESLIDGLTESPRSALPRDVDSDGDLDILVTSQTSSNPTVDRVVWWLNNGDGSVWTPRDVGSSTPLAAAADDVDQDGDIDVVSAIGTGSGPGQLILYGQAPPGDGSNWTLEPTLGSLADGEFFPADLDLADFDLDGDLDAAASVLFNASLYWWENFTSPGAWGRQDIPRVGSDDISWLRAEQADGAGPLDLVGANTSDGIMIWENRAAQAELLATDAAPAELAPASEAVLLWVNARWLGRTGDNLAEIANLALRLVDGNGTPVPDAMADSVFAKFSIWEDLDDSGDLDPVSDQLIAEWDSFTVDGDGRFVLTLPDMPAQIGPNYRDYFLVAETTSNSDLQGLASFRLTLESSRSRMEDAHYDTPLVLLSPEDHTTSQVLLSFDPNIFEDGFESGDTSAWSQAVR